MSLLDKALAIALDVHKGQKDKAGEAYILHPMTLAVQMDTEEEKVTAILHDVLEDSFKKSPLEYMRILMLIIAEMGATITEAVLAMTRREAGMKVPIYDTDGIVHSWFTVDRQEVYLSEYIHRLAKVQIAKRVKKADLFHNLDPHRLATLTDDELGRVKRYVKALQILKAS